MTPFITYKLDLRRLAKRWAHLLLLLCLLLAAGCGPYSTAQYDYEMPAQLEDGLTVGSLEDVAIDATEIATAVTEIADGKYAEVHSLLIYKDGQLVVEEYFPGHDYKWDGPGFHGRRVNWNINTPHCIHSVGKSMTSATVGIAIDQGFIESQEQSIFDYLPEHQHLKTPEKAEITIEHLLTMSSGLSWDEWGASYGDEANDLIALWFDCADPVACILEKPLVAKPGTKFAYSGGNMILLGEIVKNATGMDIEAYSADALYQPLGIDPPEWVRLFDSGVIYAGGDQRVTSRDMLKFGILYLDEGVWNGEQIVSSSWVEHSATPFSGEENSWHNSFLRPIPPGNSIWGQRGYSYAWWTHEFSENGVDMPAYWADGWGGQAIIVLPEQDAVVVITGGNYTIAPTAFSVMTDHILPALSHTQTP